METTNKPSHVVDPDNQCGAELTVVGSEVPLRCQRELAHNAIGVGTALAHVDQFGHTFRGCDECTDGAHGECLAPITVDPPGRSSSDGLPTVTECCCGVLHYPDLPEPDDIMPIVTADGVEVKPGDRVFDYYDGAWGTIQDDVDEAGWFHLQCAGRRHLLNGERVCKVIPPGNPFYGTPDPEAVKP